MGENFSILPQVEDPSFNNLVWIAFLEHNADEDIWELQKVH